MATALQYVPVTEDEVETITMYRDVCIMTRPSCPICYHEFIDQYSIGDIIAHLRNHGECWKLAVTRATQRSLDSLSNELAEDEDGRMANAPVNDRGAAASNVPSPDWSCPFCEEKFPGNLTESEFMEHVYIHDPSHEMFEDDVDAILTLVGVREEESECRICQVDLKECGIVRMLPCGHKFCQRCLARYYDDNSGVDEDGYTELPAVNPGDRLKCIFRCKLDQVLPPRGVVDLPQFFVPGAPLTSNDVMMDDMHPQGNPRPRRNRRCWLCGERNHVTDDCRHGRRIRCNRCGRNGHKAKLCWNS